MTLYFKDMNGIPIPGLDFGNLSRGMVSKPQNIKVVNDGDAINNLVLRVSGNDDIEISLPSSGKWGGEINFPIASGGMQEFLVRVRPDSSDPLGPDSGELLAIASYNFNIENF